LVLLDFFLLFFFSVTGDMSTISKISIGSSWGASSGKLPGTAFLGLVSTAAIPSSSFLDLEDFEFFLSLLLLFFSSTGGSGAAGGGDGGGGTASSALAVTSFSPNAFNRSAIVPPTTFFFNPELVDFTSLSLVDVSCCCGQPWDVSASHRVAGMFSQHP
jgi:hypothetical protein